MYQCTVEYTLLSICSEYCPCTSSFADKVRQKLQARKIIMAMACEIKSLQEGNEPLFASGKEKSMKEAEERRENTEKENKELYEKLETLRKPLMR